MSWSGLRPFSRVAWISESENLTLLSEALQVRNAQTSKGEGRGGGGGKASKQPGCCVQEVGMPGAGTGVCAPWNKGGGHKTTCKAPVGLGNRTQVVKPSGKCLMSEASRQFPDTHFAQAPQPPSISLAPQTHVPLRAHISVSD